MFFISIANKIEITNTILIATTLNIDTTTTTMMMMIEKFEELLFLSNYSENPNLDKITNVIYALYALFESMRILDGEISFKYNFNYGDYSTWKTKAKLFNDENTIYCILLDEEAITITRKK